MQIVGRISIPVRITQRFRGPTYARCDPPKRFAPLNKGPSGFYRPTTSRPPDCGVVPHVRPVEREVSEEYRLLYCDDSGAVIGLDEVQYFEPHRRDRIEPLRQLFTSSDPTARFHSMLILVAWADPAGIDAANRYVHSNHHSTTSVSFHRLNGRDTSFDELADAFAIASIPNSQDEQINRDALRPIAKRFLVLFRTEFFEHGLERFLSSLADPTLEPEIVRAVQDAAASGHQRQASDLLPAVAVTNPELAWTTIPTFQHDGEPIPGTGTGLAKTLGRIHTPEATAALNQLLHSDQPGVAFAAELALRQHRTNS